MNRSLPIVFLLTIMMSALWAQDQKSTNYIRCSSVEYEEMLRAKHPNMQTKAEFEEWMQRKLEERRNNPNAQRVATYRIPYIVHVVHAGEPVGTGDNLSQAQVDGQMKQVNDDFNRLNSDAVNTPADFLPVAAGLDIEFVPAAVSPDGDILDEPGIHRVNGLADYGISSWGGNDIDNTLKPGTGWDPNLVFNIWSVNLGGGLLGYAQFPEAPTLPGIGTGNGPSETDGVVILAGAIGSIDLPGTASPYDLGRTLTHELGHWAGLRHIWGDTGCGGDDFCDDTPTAGNSNFSGLPCSYPGANSCDDGVGDLPDMFQNYMDYSDDACMNLFTQDQADRMIIVFENSPFRDTLNESTIWQLPSTDTIIAGFDVNVTSGCAPLDVVFTDDSFVGDEADPITSWEWNFDVNGLGGVSTPTFSGQTPPTVTFSNAGTYTISLTVDNGTYSNTSTETVTVEEVIALDVVMGFESGIPMNWSNDLWIESSTVGNNSSASIYQDNFTNSGAIPAFISTPSIDMDVMATRIELTFDYAHAYYGGGFGEEEGLAIQVSTDCGETWEEIYRRLDSDPDPFFTAESTTNGWTPASDEWATENLDLTAYMGNPNVRVRFHGVSDYGNDTYLDNINIEAIVVAGNSITAEFTTDATVVCVGQEVNFVDASELGADIDDAVYEWNFDLNGTGSATPATFTGENPPAVVFGSGGTYTVQLTVSSPSEGTSDVFTLDVDIDGALDLPYSEDFESGTFPPANTTADDGWLSSIIGFDGSSFSIVADNFNEEDLVADFTLPSLDFSDVALASFSFDLSHTYFAGLFGSLFDTLRISYSLDCGASWTTIYDKNDGDPLDPLFTADPTGGEFVPAGNDEWRREEIDITFLKGNDNVKIRFENRGGFGNQLYIDNINIDAELVEEDEVFAYFVTDAEGGCVGSAITFTDQSTAGSATEITSWEWNFDVNGAGSVSPETFTGQTPPPVSFDEPGVYDVTLTVSDGVVSDDFTAQISIETPLDLTYMQDFSGSEFPPTGWTNVLWEQAAQSVDPLLGSLFASNYTEVDLKASITTPSFDLSWYDQISMEFDVAHARFSGFENEGLIINYSVDCGGTYTEIFSKFDFDAEPLYTVPDFETGAWFPEDASDWREEVADLSTLNDFSSVKLEIFNDGAFGNNTFVDDIVIEGFLFNPTELTASTSGTNNIELNWVDNSGKESAYDVLRLNNATGDFEVIATLGADATSYTDMGLMGLTEYTYQVCAYNEKARACSNEATDTTEAILVVSGLIAVVSDESGTSIELTWDDLSTTEDGFEIKRSEDGGATFTVINVLTPNQNFYLDEFLNETTTYTYQVCAFNELDTVASNMDDATTEINAPTGVTATPVDNNIALSWEDNSLVEEGYQVKRSLTPGGPYTVVTTVGPNVTVYTDFGLAELTEYCYEICAVNTIAVACADEECATTDIASGLFDELSRAIDLYPNPANDYFVLQLNSIKGDVDVKIFNPIGALIANEVLIGGALERIDIQDFAPGSYLVRIETAEGFTTKKLIVE